MHGLITLLKTEIKLKSINYGLMEGKLHKLWVFIYNTVENSVKLKVIWYTVHES